MLIQGVESNIRKSHPDLENWDVLKDYWKRQLHQTAKNFLDGDLRVDPISERETCKICDQKTFCRKTELLAFTNEEDE